MEKGNAFFQVLEDIIFFSPNPLGCLYIFNKSYENILYEAVEMFD